MMSKMRVDYAAKQIILARSFAKSAEKVMDATTIRMGGHPRYSLDWPDDPKHKA